MHIGDLVLAGEDMEIFAPQENHELLEDIMTETPEGIAIEEDPEGWMELMALEYSTGSMFYAALDKGETKE